MMFHDVSLSHQNAAKWPMHDRVLDSSFLEGMRCMRIMWERMHGS